jgi:hypothetical protein
MKPIKENLDDAAQQQLRQKLAAWREQRRKSVASEIQTAKKKTFKSKLELTMATKAPLPPWKPATKHTNRSTLVLSERTNTCQTVTTPMAKVRSQEQQLPLKPASPMKSKEDVDMTFNKDQICMEQDSIANIPVCDPPLEEEPMLPDLEMESQFFKSLIRQVLYLYLHAVKHPTYFIFINPFIFASLVIQ